MKKIYVGIDVHITQYVISIYYVKAFQDHQTEWKKTKSVTIGNNRQDFEFLDSLIKSLDASIDQVGIAIDYTGGHYSEPISYFLKLKGYEVYYLGAASVKAAKERLLGEENKTDKIDSATLAYLLYLRDFYKINLNISATSADFESRSSLLRALLLQGQYYRKMSIQTTNRLHQYFHSVFPEGEEKYFKQLLNILSDHPTPKEIIDDPEALKKIRISLVTRNKILDLAKNTIGVPGHTYKAIIQDLALLHKLNKEKTTSIDKTVKELVEEHPYYSILTSFPGIKEKSAAIIISTVKDIKNWPTKNKFKKGLGVYGTVRESGKINAKFKRGLSGDRICRQCLFMVCFTAARLKTNNDFPQLFSM